MAANSTCIEPENADSTHTIDAKVVAIDYESNPALLAPNNGDTENSFSGLKPLTLGGATKIGAKVEVWQLEDKMAESPTVATRLPYTSKPLCFSSQK